MSIDAAQHRSANTSAIQLSPDDTGNTASKIKGAVCISESKDSKKLINNAMH